MVLALMLALLLLVLMFQVLRVQLLQQVQTHWCEHSRCAVGWQLCEQAGLVGLGLRALLAAAAAVCWVGLCLLLV